MPTAPKAPAAAMMQSSICRFMIRSSATTRCYVLADGRVAESGQTADILQSPHTKVASQLVTSARALSLRIDAETK